MPPASRGFRPLLKLDMRQQPIRCFHCQSFLRATYRRSRLDSRQAQPEHSFAKRFFKIPFSRFLSQIRAPFSHIRAQLMRIPAPWRRFIGDTLKFLPIVWIGILHFPYQIMHANGPSMTPFINPNNSPDLPETKDRLLVRTIGGFPSFNEWKAGLTRTPLQRGEIVVFWTPHDPTKVAVKRVVGLPGDRVAPLKGYEGDEEVVVQYNHMWVEGDVDDREKSRDSNWYGQISQNLVIGRVVAVLSGFWSPTFLNIAEHNWPAKRKGRVVENAVETERLNMDQQDKLKHWTDGSAQSLLDQLTTHRSQIINTLMLRAADRQRAAKYYTDAVEEAARNDPDTRQISRSIATLFSEIFTETGFEPVLDQKYRPDLLPTEEAARKMQEWKVRSQAEEVNPEEQLRISKLKTAQAFAKAEEDIDRYDEWWFFSKLRPKSVLSAHLDRRKQKYEQEYRERERELVQIREVERLERGHVGAVSTVAGDERRKGGGTGGV